MEDIQNLVPTPRLMLRHESLSIVCLGPKKSPYISDILSVYPDIPSFEMSDGVLVDVLEIDGKRRSQIVLFSQLDSIECSTVALALLEQGFDVFFAIEDQDLLNTIEMTRLLAAGVIPIPSAKCLTELQFNARNQ